MTLNERFQQWFINDVEEHYEGTVEEVAIEHERLADEFAIEFAKYVLSQIYNMTHGNKAGISIEELLEIYKKEKGL